MMTILETLILALVPIWRNNGQVEAKDIRDKVLKNLSFYTGRSIENLEKEIKTLATKLHKEAS